MPVVFLIATVAVLGGVFFAATGRGGEMAPEHPDHAPLDLGPVSAPDIALLRPPAALWGYNMQVTDEALDHIARAMRDRDVTIANLQQQLTSRDAQDPSASPAPMAPQAPQTPLASPPALQPSLASPLPPIAEAHQAPRINKAPGGLVAPLPHRASPPTEVTQPAEATQPTEVTQPAEATQPAQALPASSFDVQGPQGSYDTHGWWAQQEEAEREEALRQAQARAGAEAPSGEPGAPEAAGHLATPPADRHDSEPGRTSTQPNPTVTSPPDDEALAVAEEQGW